MLESFFAVRCVVQHAEAVNHIEAFRGERQFENVRLHDRRIAVGEVPVGGFYSAAQVDANEVSAPTRDHFSVASHAAPDIKDKLAGKIVRPQPCLLHEIQFGAAAGCAIQLRGVMLQPLEAETPGVVLCIDEAQNSVDKRVFAAAIFARHACTNGFEPPFAVNAAENVDYDFRGSLPGHLVAVFHRVFPVSSNLQNLGGLAYRRSAPRKNRSYKVRWCTPP